MANKRVIELPDLSQDVQEGQYILVDSSGGTGKMDLKHIVDEAGSFDPEGIYPALYAGNLTTDKEQTDTAPYLFRPAGGGLRRIGERCYPVLVGASVAENQLIKNGNFESTTRWSASSGATFTVSDNVATFRASARYQNLAQGSSTHKPISGHVYFGHVTAKSYTASNTFFYVRCVSSGTVVQTGSKTLPTTRSSVELLVKMNQSGTQIQFMVQDNNPSDFGDITVENAQLIDLTLLLGSTIADYVYTLEQATAGSGITWLRSYGFLGGYVPYNSGTIESVEATAKVVRDENGENAVTYPLGSDVLRGIFKLDANNNLYAYGDRKESDGTITRNFKIISLGDYNWYVADSTAGRVYCTKITDMWYDPSENGSMKHGEIVSDIYTANGTGDKVIDAFYNISYSGYRIFITDSALSGMDNAQVKQYFATNATKLVYKIATPTTEQGDPFPSPQIVYPDGTEEFVTENGVPVGHETEYPYDLKALVEGLIDVPDVPSANGTYVLKATRSASGIVYNWVTG